MKRPNAEIEKLLSTLANPQLAAIDLSLYRIRKLLSALGNPQDRLPPVIHVAGTNGKGSLLAYLTAICESAGYKVNRFTSPHLVKFNEEIYLCGKEISDEHLLDLLKRVLPYIQNYPVTFFEAHATLAFMAFAETKSDIVLLETGLGGRLDATNTIEKPALTAITPVSIDHSEFLGDTIAKIAGEKAGIIKPGVPCIVGKQLLEAAQVIEAAANTMKAHLYRFGIEWQVTEIGQGFHYKSVKRDIRFPLPSLSGRHQIMNAASAIACVDCLHGFNIKNEHISRGITHTIWPARLQHIRKGRLANLLPANSELWLDGGHNPDAGKILAEWIGAQEKPVHVISGILRDKDARQILAPILPLIKSFTAISIDSSRPSHKPQSLVNIAMEFNTISRTAENASETIHRIVKEEGENFIILICGSLYLAGNILWQNDPDMLK